MTELNTANNKKISELTETTTVAATDIYPLVRGTDNFKIQYSNLIANATATVRGTLKLAGDLSGTAEAPTVPGLASKAPITNPAFLNSARSPNPGTTEDSDIIATTFWVNQKLGSFTATVPDATTTVKGIVQLAGDLGGTSAAPTVPGLTSKAPINQPAFTNYITIDTHPELTENSFKVPTTKWVVDKLAAANVVVEDAAATTKGILRLNGDLGGTALLPEVVKLKGVSINATNASAYTVMSVNANSEISFSTWTDSLTGQIEKPLAKKYVLDARAGFKYIIKDVYLKTSVGTCTAKLSIGTTAITGLDAINVPTLGISLSNAAFSNYITLASQPNADNNDEGLVNESESLVLEISNPSQDCIDLIFTVSYVRL